MGKYRPSGKLIVAGLTVATDAPIVNFQDCPWDASRETCIATDVDPNPPCANGVPYGSLPSPTTKRIDLRPPLRSYGHTPPMAAVSSVIRKIILHHDGMGSSEMAFSVMHNERGLSEHFYIDNDGVIYQTCDVAMMALHAAELNADSIGISLCNRGDARKEPNYYASRGTPRDVKPCTINGNAILAFDFTKQQYQSLSSLIAALLRVLPDIPPTYPTGPDGRQLWGTLPAAKALAFAGIMGNYHRTDRKWDPGPLDFAAVLQRFRGRPCFPLAVGKRQPAPIDLDTSETVREEATALYDNSDRASGPFPIAPWGKTALWHGGVHVNADEGRPVVAPFPGTIVAARSSTTPVGSGSFVLIRHEIAFGSVPARIFTLYMHLSGLDGGDQAPPWMKRDRIVMRPGEVQLLRLPIEAGAELGRVGVAGPAGKARAQLHLEAFSATELRWPGSPFQAFDGSASGRICRVKEILANPSAEAMRYFVTYHLSEWSSEAGWAAALYGRTDVSDSDIDRLIADQITPLLWWNEQVAVHCGMPSDGVVYHYHPISLIRMHNQLRLDAAAIAAPTDRVVEDNPCNDQITLEALATGQHPRCGPTPEPTQEPADIPTAPKRPGGGLIDI